MLQDFSYAVRTLLRARAFTITAALTLALGIGANTVMFSVVDAVLIRPLPYRDPGRLVVVQSVNKQKDVGQIRTTALDFYDWRNRARSFDAIAAHVGTGYTFTDGTPELVVGQLVTADFFKVIGVPPLLGRTFTPDEFEPGRERTMLVGYRLWQRRFGGDPSIVGRSITVNGKPFVVAGVMPRGFEYPEHQYQLWTPLPARSTVDGLPINRASHYLRVVARLATGVTRERAQADMSAIASALAEAYPDTNDGLGVRVAALADELVGDVRTALLVLLGAVGFVTLIACTNVTNLLLARATGREREVAIRAALGAGRWRLVRQFLVETIALYAIAAAGALAIASWGLALFVSLNPGDVPRLAEASLDTRVLTATLGVSLLAAIVFGLAPALHAAKTDVSDALKTGGRTIGASGARQTLRSILVVGELALSVVLLVGAGLALRSFVRLQQVDPGFRVDDQLTFTLVMPQAGYPSASHQIAFSRRLVDELAATPGIEHAGSTTQLPFSGQNLENGFTVEGLAIPPGGEQPIAGMRGITPDYFAALGVPLKGGRAFTGADREGAMPVAIVNDAFARRYWPGASAIGKRVREAGGDDWRTVVGIVGDIRHSGPAAEARPEVDIPYAQLEPGFMTRWARGITIVVSSSLPSSALVPLARARVAAIDSSMPLNEVQAVSALASDAVAQPRLRTVLMGTFALLALTLATIGVFGVLSYFVTQRTQEIGIRMALGARAADVVGLVVRQGVTLAGVGVLLGLAAAVPLSRLMQELLFEVKPTDPATFVVVAAVLAAVAGLASYIPARRAARVDPVTALRSE
jgi:putative ABC transport system permease protein